MDSPHELEKLSEDIKNLFHQHPDEAEHLIESYLQESLNAASNEQKLSVIKHLIQIFKSLQKTDTTTDPYEMQQIFSLLIGKDMGIDGLSQSELLNRLAESLNDLFDTLNEISRVINMTLTGQEIQDQTIRTVIGRQIERDTDTATIDEYLNRIKNAFLTAHQAFKETAKEKVDLILTELNPDRMAEESSGGLKIGPMKRAEYFDIYQEKYEKIQKWFESGRFLDDFLMAFEKRCSELTNR